MSRFEEALGEEPHRTLLKEIFNEQIRTLGEVVADLGKDTAGDATGLSKRAVTEATAKAEMAEGLPQPSGGRKEYTEDDGTVTKVVQWFGYKLHLLVDVKHEASLCYEITDTKAGDGETLPTLLQQAKANLPPDRIRTLAYDKAADTNPVHELLSEEHIRAVIQNRSLWKEDLERMLPGHDGHSNIVYDEAGTVYCYDRESQPMVRDKMAYIGYEPERETIKYRCPAMHEDWPCPMSAICNAGEKYGKTIRVPREIDVRRFPAVPRATKQFERLYDGRTSVERVNGRLKIFWGLDDGNIRGARRFVANVGAAMVVHAAFATLLASRSDEGTLVAARKRRPTRSFVDHLQFHSAVGQNRVIPLDGHARTFRLENVSWHLLLVARRTLSQVPANCSCVVESGDESPRSWASRCCVGGRREPSTSLPWWRQVACGWPSATTGAWSSSSTSRAG